MMPDSMFESQNFQENIDRIRLEQGFDFAALAFYESASTFSPINGNMCQAIRMIDIN